MNDGERAERAANPYDPPRHSSAFPKSHPFLAWERLRPHFNLVAILCIALTTGPGQPRLLDDSRFWESSLLVLCACNVAFTFGHVLERLWGGLAGNGRSRRAIWFVGFCLCALVIAFAAVAAEMYPGI